MGCSCKGALSQGAVVSCKGMRLQGGTQGGQVVARGHSFHVSQTCTNCKVWNKMSRNSKRFFGLKKTQEKQKFGGKNIDMNLSSARANGGKKVSSIGFMGGRVGHHF